MRTTDLQDRAQYLSLALFSQKVVSTLMEYVDENKHQKLKDSLKEALDALAQAKRPYVSSRPRVAAFKSYEHLRTLEEVWSAKDRAKAERMIRTVQNAPRGDAKSKALANTLIDLFSKLHDQALWNFEQPKPVSERVMQRLCRLA